MEEFDGVGVEGEALEVPDKVVGEDFVEVEDVDRDVHDRADDDQAGKEGDHSHHAPITSFNIDLRKRGSGSISFSSACLLICSVAVRGNKVIGGKIEGEGKKVLFNQLLHEVQYSLGVGEVGVYLSLLSPSQRPPLCTRSVYIAQVSKRQSQRFGREVHRAAHHESVRHGSRK